MSSFREKLYEMKSAEDRKRILMRTDFRVSFNTVLVTYIWIGHILKRIDNELSNDLAFLETLRLVERGVHVTVNDLPPSDPNLTNIDIMSLIIFSNILMDDIARFLNFLFWGESKPKTKNFDVLKKTIGNFDGCGLEKLKQIIQNTSWYEQLKELRDKPIVHKGKKDISIGGKGQTIGIWLRYIRDGKIKEWFYANTDIDKLCGNMLRFLTDLNTFLCQNFESLPIKVVNHA